METRAREAFYGYVPEAVRDYLAFKEIAGSAVAGPETRPVPKVPFQWLTSLEVGTRGWAEAARNAGWQMSRMNLNTFARHGVFKDKGMVKLIAAWMRDAEAVAKARVFPYSCWLPAQPERSPVTASLSRAFRKRRRVGMEAPRGAEIADRIGLTGFIG